MSSKNSQGRTVTIMVILGASFTSGTFCWISELIFRIGMKQSIEFENSKRGCTNGYMQNMDDLQRWGFAIGGILGVYVMTWYMHDEML